MRLWPFAVLCLIWADAGFPSDGEYLFHAAGCLACHTTEGGRPLAGGREFDTPFGVFYSPNITPDPITGIGRWSKGEFVAAVKRGLAPDGSAYFPVFPYTSYRQMTDGDAGRLYDFLQTREPVSLGNRDHELAWWLGRWMMGFWQRWMLDEAPVSTRSEPALDRGRYLVDALGHCGECHTPRNRWGVSDRNRHLAGTKDGPDGESVPNITPDRPKGIGKWDADDLEYFLESGALPDGDYTGGLMSEVIDNTTSRLTPSDRRAIVSYLRSVPAVSSP